MFKRYKWKNHLKFRHSNGLLYRAYHNVGKNISFHLMYHSSISPGTFKRYQENSETALNHRCQSLVKQLGGLLFLIVLWDTCNSLVIGYCFLLAYTPLMRLGVEDIFVQPSLE